MIIEKHLKRYIAVFFAAFYLFVALFSENFHEHGSGVFFKQLNIKKTEKSISTSDVSVDFDHCLSCHFLHEGKIFPDANYNLKFQFVENFFHKIYGKSFSFFQTERFHFNLRGPPQTFILKG